MQLAKVNSLLPVVPGGQQLELPERVGKLLGACVRLASAKYGPDITTAAFLLRRRWLQEMEALVASEPPRTYKNKVGEDVIIQPHLFALLPMESKKARFVTIDKMIALRLTGTWIQVLLMLVCFTFVCLLEQESWRNSLRLLSTQTCGILYSSHHIWGHLHQSR
jgi:hypothetical protein